MNMVLLPRVFLKLGLGVVIGLLTACGGSDTTDNEISVNTDHVAPSSEPQINTWPVIAQFIADSSTSVPVIQVSIKAKNTQGIAGWLISESASIPDSDDNNWKSESPVFYSLFSSGETILHAWAKDYAGNVSEPITQVVNYELPPQYANYKSGDYFKSPQEAVRFIKVSADFWKASRDDVNGGFFTYGDQRGNVTGNRNKSFLTQSRNAYGFARAFMVTGDERYLDDAKHALKFLYEHGWDETNGGWYFIADEYGDIHTGSGWEWDHNTKTKWSFQQHYALLGIGAFYEATREDADLQWLTRGYETNETHLWDSDPKSYGYYDLAAKDWSSPRGKGFTPTVDAITTHVLGLYLLTEDQKYLDRLRALGNNIIDHLGASMDDPQVKVGMVEQFNSDWTVNTDAWKWDSGDVGHVLKSAWSLARIYLLTGDGKYREAARKFMQRTLTDGTYDHFHGGPYTEFNWNTGAIPDKDKDFWHLEQGYTGGIIHWYIDDDPSTRESALEIARGSIDFFMSHLPDRFNGGIFERASFDGASITSNTKSGLFKAGYHGIELGYYAYLYGSLYYANQPVSLYYKLEKTQTERTLKLTPLAIEDDKLVIIGVKLNGQLYSDFDPLNRILRVPGGVGGKFQVTFRRKE